MIISKKDYLKGFGCIVLVLALVRCIFPSVAGSLNEKGDTSQVDAAQTDSLAEKAAEEDSTLEVKAESKNLPLTAAASQPEAISEGDKHPIIGVLSYSKAFPDSNDVQYAAAMQHGVQAVMNREEAEERKGELVYMAASPYYQVDKLKSSIPYLVPRAAVLLNDIGRNFFDSLYVKRVPFHQFVVTSVLRSQNDLDKLKEVNHNVSENSCHLYGTTFDIGYNRYKTVSDPDGKPLREVGNDTLKWVLSEVLRDLREEGRCYVKYEVKQGCFHVTVR